MKFRCHVEELQRALKIFSPIVNYAHPVLGFRYLKITSHNNRLEIKGFDNSIVGSAFPNCITFEYDAKNGYVLAKQFISLINSFKSDEVSVDIKNEQCIIKSGRSTYKLPLLDEETFKSFIGELDLDYYSQPKDAVSVKTKDFITKALSVVHAVSKDDYHKELQHIYIKDSDMIACDGVRGAFIEFDYPSLNNLMIHRRIISCIESLDPNSLVKFYVEDGRLYGATNQHIFCSSVDDCDYPYENISKYLKNFNEKKKYQIEIPAQTLVNKLGRLLMFTDSETNAVEMRFTAKDIILKVEHSSYAEEVIPMIRENDQLQDEFSVYVDGRSLKESLNKVLSQAVWSTDGEESAHYIHDGELCQFFLGLDK